MSKNNIFNVLCYIALVIAAALLLLKWILGVFNVSINIGILNAFVNIILYCAVAYMAYGWQRGKKVAYQVIYWLAFIIALVFIILPAAGII
ncbi:MAG: hypothetical protein ACI4S9_01265 [Christensenellales bacterium]